jgi:large subunit ribosomal protein L3
MTGFILGKKSRQSQTFTKEGKRIPSTYIATKPNYLVAIRTDATDGYCSLKLGFCQVKNITKPQRGELNKAGIKTPLRFFKEFRINPSSGISIIEENKKKGISFGDKKIFIGDLVLPSIFFKPGDTVAISGISKGKGFQGVVKRHGFKGGPRTHGQSDRERAPGSIGMSTTPGRVFKGKRMAGRMGGERITVKNLEILSVSDDGITIKGLIPGSIGGLVEIKE